MTYEEKRELRLQISQLLADAGINQNTIKEMVKTEVNNKVERKVEEIMNKLDIDEYIKNVVVEFLDDADKYGTLKSAMTSVLSDRVAIKIVDAKEHFDGR